MEITQALKEKIHEVAVLLAMDTRDDLDSTKWTEYAERVITKRLKGLPDITAETSNIEWVKKRAIEIYKGKKLYSCIGSVQRVLNELIDPVIEEIKSTEANEEVTVKPEGVFIGDEMGGEYIQRFTLEQVEEILTNMGHDVTCGTCMEIAFTGGGSGHEHTCKQKDEQQLIFEVNEIPEKITDIFNHLETNTYVLSCHFNRTALYGAMRMDIEILCEYIKHIVPEVEDLSEKAYVKMALEVIECMCGGDLAITDQGKFKDGIYEAAHTALNTCSNDHEDWRIRILELWESFKEGGLI